MAKDNGAGIDISKINNWKQIVAIILSLGVIPLANSITILDESAYIKIIVIGILASLAFYVIHRDTKIALTPDLIENHKQYLRANQELLEDMVVEYQNKLTGATGDRKTAYQEILDNLCARLNQVKLVQKETMRNGD